MTLKENSSKKLKTEENLENELNKNLNNDILVQSNNDDNNAE